MNLTPTVEEFGSTSPSWLGSAHGAENARTVTLNLANFAAFDSIIPSGVPLKEDADGRFSPVTAAGDYLAGFLLTEQANKGDYQVAPMTWHGRILANRLPDVAFDVRTLSDPNPQFTIEPRPLTSGGGETEV